jgi:hypothetical protein
MLAYIVVRARNALDVCAGGEEASLAGEHGEDGIGVVIEVAQGGDDRWDRQTSLMISDG